MIEVKKDCFAYSKTPEKCNALSVLLCKNKQCPFYKPKKKPREDRSW